jgi:hypothetical protein
MGSPLFTLDKSSSSSSKIQSKIPGGRDNEGTINIKEYLKLNGPWEKSNWIFSWNANVGLRNQIMNPIYIQELEHSSLCRP